MLNQSAYKTNDEAVIDSNKVEYNFEQMIEEALNAQGGAQQNASKKRNSAVKRSKTARNNSDLEGEEETGKPK